MSEQPVGSPLSMHDPPTVGPWTLQSRLGAGGMGVVFYGRAPGRGVAAVKVIRPGLLDAPATRDRFRREVAILRSVRDTHICAFLDADLESEPAWLAIEYVSGPVLRDEILANGPLAEDQWWEVARGLAQALAVLDVHRITHRDLKPGNVILNERGPVLIDFGIAHPEDATALTATGLVTGSPAWLSPEQANLEPTGPASDIFTLGSLLAFAATGRPPFGEGASVAVLVAITTREPDLLGVDPARTALLRRMLAKDPRSRPSARQILDLTRASGTGSLRPQSGLLTDPGTTRTTRVPRPPQPSETTTPDATLAPDKPQAAQAPEGMTPEHAAEQAPEQVSVPAPEQVSEPSPLPATAAGPVQISEPSPPPVPGAGPHQEPASALESGSASPAPMHPTRAPTPTAGGAPPPVPAPPPAPSPTVVAPASRSAPEPAASGAPPAMPPDVQAAPGPSPAPSRRPVARWIAIAAVVGLVVLGGWWGLGLLTGGEYGGTPPGTSSSGAPSAGRAPAAPSADVLRSGDWLLAQYRLVNEGTDLSVSGTVTNRGSSTGSADLTVWVYLADGTSLGSVGTRVRDVPAGGSVQVTMTGDAVWEPGAKVVLLEAR